MNYAGETWHRSSPSDVPPTWWDIFQAHIRTGDYMEAAAMIEDESDLAREKDLDPNDVQALNDQLAGRGLVIVAEEDYWNVVKL